jgi:large subunit ribosomal protein L9
MKVILRADVDNLGRLGEEVDVKPGYGRNYLLPMGLAMPATESSRKVFEQERKKLQAKMDAVRAEAQDVAEKLEGKDVVIRMRVGEAGKLYGSVTSSHIVDALEEMGIELDKRKVLLPEPIRSLGRHAVPVRLHQDVESELTVIVVPHDWKEGDPIPGEEEEAEEAAEVSEEDIYEPQPVVETEAYTPEMAEADVQEEAEAHESEQDEEPQE